MNKTLAKLNAIKDEIDLLEEVIYANVCEMSALRKSTRNPAGINGYRCDYKVTFYTLTEPYPLIYDPHIVLLL